MANYPFLIRLNFKKENKGYQIDIMRIVNNILYLRIKSFQSVSSYRQHFISSL